MNQRTTLGVVGCLVLGDEMAYVLENDPDLQNILIVDTDEGRMFREKLGSAVSGQDITMVREDELGHLDPSGPSAVVWVNGADLHESPKEMLERLASNVHFLEGHCGSVLLFYGLCRNTKYEMERFADRFEVPVTLLIDEDGAVVDDCFAAVLGGRERYAKMLRANDKAILLTHGYAEHWARKLEGYGLEAMLREFENYESLFDAMGYKKVMMLENGLGAPEELGERACSFASVFDMTVETARCDTRVFERSYCLAWSRVNLLPMGERAQMEINLSRMLP